MFRFQAGARDIFLFPPKCSDRLWGLHILLVQWLPVIEQRGREVDHSSPPGAKVNRLTPNDPYMGHTAPLTSKRCILYIYSTNVGTEYFKHSLYSPFSSLQNAVCFIMLTCLVLVLFTFYIQGVLKLNKKKSGAKGLRKSGATLTFHNVFMRSTGGDVTYGAWTRYLTMKS